jgi:predicted DNA-binding protein YlxM (UPF0122 family)
MTTTTTTAAIEELSLKEIADLERLTTPAVHNAIQRNLSKGFTVLEVARSLSERVKCSMRVARSVVWGAQDEWMTTEH